MMHSRGPARARLFAPRRLRRRAFTLVELVLAAALGVFIIISVFGLFSVLRVSQERSAERAAALHELATLQGTLAQSFRTLVVLESARTPARPAGATRTEPATPDSVEKLLDADAPPDAAANALPPRAPRLLLEQADTDPFPRLEMVTAALPISVEMPDGTPGFLAAEAGGGVRGAFELQPGAHPDSYDVYFRAYELLIDDPNAARVALGERLICRDLVSFDVTFFKTEGNDEDEQAAAAEQDPDRPRLRPRTRSNANEQLAELGPLPARFNLPPDGESRLWSQLAAARTYAHLPAFVEVEAVTRQGLRGRWLFEVKWIVAREPDSSTALASGEAAGAGGALDDAASGDADASGRRRTGNSRRPSKERPDGSTFHILGPDGRPR